MDNQLIVYKPKKNTKKIILSILLVTLISILIFVISVVCSTFFFTQKRWNETEYPGLHSIKI